MSTKQNPETSKNQPKILRSQIEQGLDARINSLKAEDSKLASFYESLKQNIIKAFTNEKAQLSKTDLDQLFNILVEDEETSKFFKQNGIDSAQKFIDFLLMEEYPETSSGQTSYILNERKKNGTKNNARNEVYTTFKSEKGDFNIGHGGCVGSKRRLYYASENSAKRRAQRSLAYKQLYNMVKEKGYSKIFALAEFRMMKKIVKKVNKKLLKEGAKPVELVLYKINYNDLNKNMIFINTLAASYSNGESSYLMCRGGRHRSSALSTIAWMATGKAKTLKEAISMSGLDIEVFKTCKRNRNKQLYLQLIQYAVEHNLEVDKESLAYWNEHIRLAKRVLGPKWDSVNAKIVTKQDNVPPEVSPTTATTVRVSQPQVPTLVETTASLTQQDDSSLKETEQQLGDIEKISPKNTIFFGDSGMEFASRPIKRICKSANQNTRILCRGGSTVFNIVERVKKNKRLVRKAKQIIFKIGANDLYTTTPENVIKRLKYLFRIVKRINPSARIVISTLGPNKPNRFTEEKLLRRFARKGIVDEWIRNQGKGEEYQFYAYKIEDYVKDPNDDRLYREEFARKGRDLHGNKHYYETWSKHVLEKFVDV